MNESTLNATTTFFLLVWHSNPFSIPIHAFWVIIFLSFDVQNHCSVWHSVPPSFVSSAFKAIVRIHSKTLSHHLSVLWHSESFLLDCIVQGHSPWHSYSLALNVLPSWLCIYPRFPHRVTLCLSLIRHCSSRILFSLLLAQSFEFTTHISVMLLGTLRLALSCSSIRVVFSRHVLYGTSEWFNHYSSLIWLFKSLMEMS